MSAPEPTLFRLPKLYENMDEATIGEWFVAPGDSVSEGQLLVELITDKTVLEYEAPVAGTLLAVYAQTKSTVPLNYILCAFGAADQAAPDVAAENAAIRDAARPDADLVVPPPPAPAAPPPPRAKPRVAPAARALAREHAVDLDALAATLTEGQVIHRKDVETYIAAQSAAPTAAAAAPTADATPTAAARPAARAPHLDPSAPRVALITGATGDIGQAIARALADQGYHLALHYHQNTDAANDLATAFRARGLQVELLPGDLHDAQQCAAIVYAARDRFDRLDVLVNNAGLLRDGLLSFMQDDAWHEVIDLNLNAPFYLCRAAAMIMARQRGGKIINIASDAGRMGGAGRSNYSAAKAGLSGFTRAVARELAGSNVQVNAVSPGFVESRMTGVMSDLRKKALIKEIPARRFAEPAEVAALVAFLASPACNYITGQDISIDGGLYMGG